MKIGILTQPLRSNYGGILQNWALQQVLRRMGHEPVTVRYGEFTRVLRVKIYMRWLFSQIIPGGRCDKVQLPDWDKKHIVCHTRFVKQYIAQTKGNLTCSERNWGKDGFGAYIIGSDQVWRPCYNWSAGATEAMFGGYIPRWFSGPVISYAASFGTDDWTFTPVQTYMARKLIKRFNVVSVREKSGVAMCRAKLDVEATQVLDPTMLLGRDDYMELVTKKDLDNVPDGAIGVYILDFTQEKTSIVEYTAKRLGKPVFYFGVADFSRVKDSIESWLAAFERCSCIITDSFHGTVFSILFHKPFRTIINSNRGMSRFVSLLDDVGLSDRLVVENPISPIDWRIVEARLAKLREKSINFLTENLNE